MHLTRFHKGIAIPAARHHDHYHCPHWTHMPVAASEEARRPRYHSAVSAAAMITKM
ncbi:hypothetical protein BJV74DRAFT_818797 [Russula compacta]|nr:hypothetical protein BJV74DRAFT_818797 [Russula compacta]